MPAERNCQYLSIKASKCKHTLGKLKVVGITDPPGRVKDVGTAIRLIVGVGAGRYTVEMTVVGNGQTSELLGPEGKPGKFGLEDETYEGGVVLETCVCCVDVAVLRPGKVGTTMVGKVRGPPGSCRVPKATLFEERKPCVGIVGISITLGSYCQAVHLF